MMLVFRRFLLYLGIIVLAGSISGLAALNGPDLKTTTSAPTTTSAASTTAAPTTTSTTAAPTTTSAASTTAAPTTTSAASTTAAPTTEATTAAPTTEATTAAPTTEATTAAPTTEATTAAPTTAAPTTSTAPPTPSPNESLNTYKVAEGNTSCLMMTMEAHLQYNNDQNQSAVINVTDSYSVDSAGSNCSYLIITSGANSLTFAFKQSADNKTYTLDQVAVTFDQVHAKKGGLDIGQVAVKASYVCNSGAKVDFDGGNVLVMRKIHFQAFTMDGDKYSTAFACTTDFNPIVPIIVGAVLAGIVVLVVIVYILGRRRTRTGYEEI